ncbi:MAG TPA: hypothetical protein VGN15_11655 [Ktedonobacteraceae bacterium]|nr:hypothetical protein [Ktedonobacteraceae bacterium]
MRYIMRYIVAALAVFLLACITAPLLTTSYAAGHGCAQPVPPGIPGSPAPAPAASGIIVINEVLLYPHSTWNCSEHNVYSTTTDSWIELYNTQNQPYNLYTAHTTITDDTNTTVYYLPFGASIAAHGYLVLFPYTTGQFRETSTPTLKLSISSVVVDQVSVPLLGLDQSYARTADGASTWQTSTLPTIDASNTSLVVTPTTATSSSPTSVPTSSSSGGRSGTGQGGFMTPTRTSSTDRVLVSGRQPQWSNMQLPTVATMPTATLLQSSPAPSSPGNVGLDTTRRILLTILVIGLALTLFWCWWLYRST